MPFIEEEKLAELQNELENFNQTQEELEEKIERSKNENKSLNNTIKGLIALLILLGIGLFVFGMLYFQTKKEKQSISLKQERIISQKIDSIQNVYQANGFSEGDSDEDYDSNNESFDELIYTIQIGAFRKYDLSKYPKDELKNFRSIPNKDLNTYSIGKLKTIAQARNFLKEIRRIGIRDAFILPIKNGQRISLKEAMAIENQ